MKTFIYPLIITLLAAILTACGGDSAAAPATPVQADAAVQAAQEEPAPAAAGDPAVGQDLYGKTCVACHGPNGEGVTGLGRDMTTSTFIAEKSDAELIEFIKVGRDPSDPLNTTGVAMPAKGGNPALSDEDLQHIIAYIRTLHK